VRAHAQEKAGADAREGQGQKARGKVEVEAVTDVVTRKVPHPFSEVPRPPSRRDGGPVTAIQIDEKTKSITVSPETLAGGMTAEGAKEARAKSSAALRATQVEAQAARQLAKTAEAGMDAQRRELAVANNEREKTLARAAELEKELSLSREETTRLQAQLERQEAELREARASMLESRATVLESNELLIDALAELDMAGAERAALREELAETQLAVADATRDIARQNASMERVLERVTEAVSSDKGLSPEEAWTLLQDLAPDFEDYDDDDDAQGSDRFVSEVLQASIRGGD